MTTKHHLNLSGSTSRIKLFTMKNGKPVMLHPRLIKYHWDFIGFDFNYLLSQDDYDATYVGLVEDFFANEVNDQLVEFNKQAIDETRILFKPRSTMGFTQDRY